MRRIVAFCLAAVLAAGCAGTPQAPGIEPLLRDAAFAPPSRPVEPAAVLAASDAMRGWIERAGLGRPGADARRQLVARLYERDQLRLEYEGATRTAAEAFDARAGNCLSLVAMTAALARAAGLPVQFRSVAVEPDWTRRDDLVFGTGHVNVAIGRPAPPPGTLRADDGSLIVDFLPGRDVAGARWRPIGEATVVAMFMNNRAAEALAEDRLDDAYWHAREALRQDPHFSAGYNTLAVVYRRHGLADAAERVWGALLAREPANASALANLAALLRHDGRVAEADALAARLAAIEPAPPFHWFDAGLQALRAGDVRRARDLFAREVARDAAHHEFHFWLARAEALLGHAAEARRQRALAHRTGPTPQTRALYAAKLERLRDPERR